MSAIRKRHRRSGNVRNGADDSLIEEKMREAVFFKPDGHEFGRSGKGEEIETKKMSDPITFITKFMRKGG